MENHLDDYSNADLPSDSEIVITCPALGEGGGVKTPESMTVGSVTVVAEAIASLTPVEIAPEAAEAVADEVEPQLLLQGMVETTPDPWEEPSTPANVDAGECENPATPTEVAPEAVPTSVEDEVGVNDEPAAKEKQWAWNKTTGESLGEVLSINPIKGAKIRRSGELPRYAKFYPLQEITFDNPVVQALSLNTSPVANTQWGEAEQFLEEID